MYILIFNFENVWHENLLLVPTSKMWKILNRFSAILSIIYYLCRLSGIFEYYHIQSENYFSITMIILEFYLKYNKHYKWHQRNKTSVIIARLITEEIPQKKKNWLNVSSEITILSLEGIAVSRRSPHWSLSFKLLVLLLLQLSKYT